MPFCSQIADLSDQSLVGEAVCGQRTLEGHLMHAVLPASLHRPRRLQVLSGIPLWVSSSRSGLWQKAYGKDICSVSRSWKIHSDWLQREVGFPVPPLSMLTGQTQWVLV